MMQVVTTTPAEFKAWFAGFAEHINVKPTEVEWERIKAQVRQISASNGVNALVGLQAAALNQSAQSVFDQQQYQLRNNATGSMGG